MQLTQEICNPEKKKDITAKEIVANINNHFDCKIASLEEENHILIDSCLLQLEMDSYGSSSKITINI